MFGERLKQLRNEAGLSLTELGVAADIHRQTVIDYEGNRRVPSLDIAQRLARALGQSITCFDGVTFEHATQRKKPTTIEESTDNPSPPPKPKPKRGAKSKDATVEAKPKDTAVEAKPTKKGRPKKA